MPDKLPKAAIIYDFDGTLSPGNLPEHSLFPFLGIGNAKAFWDEVKEIAKERDADEVLTYMGRILEVARKGNIEITKPMLEEHGKKTPAFEGVDQWFDRVGEHGRNIGFEIEHYVISSGLLELIRGCKIFARFVKVFACSYAYDGKGVAVWPASAINYTNKTQFLFRINKGILNTWDNAEINRWQPPETRPIPFKRMLFLGDGDTDIPTMKMIRYKGGQAIAVFDQGRFKERAAQGKLELLIAEDRVDYVAAADYSAGSVLDVTVRGIFGRMARRP